MIFVSADWAEDIPQIDCVEVSFDGGRFGGGVEFITCAGIQTAISVGPGQQSIIYCVQNNSWTGTLNVILYGPCGGDRGGPIVRDKVFTVQYEKVIAYAKYDINYDPEEGALDPWVYLEDAPVNCWIITGVVTPQPDYDGPTYNILEQCPR